MRREGEEKVARARLGSWEAMGEDVEVIGDGGARAGASRKGWCDEGEVIGEGS